jgi:hypothetical protein
MWGLSGQTILYQYQFIGREDISYSMCIYNKFCVPLLANTTLNDGRKNAGCGMSKDNVHGKFS